MPHHDAYEPLDLTPHRNTAAAVLAHDQGDAAVGLQYFHGLPFRIGERDAAFIGLGEGLSSTRVSIPVQQSVFTVVFAHRLVGSHIPEGGPAGVACAEYVFHMADGARHAVVIRDRFQIADLTLWGNQPFLAQPDQQHHLQARWRGAWAEAGFRQTESAQGSGRNYFLWRWRNPTPDLPLATIEIIPGAPKVLVAAITLGRVDEDPLRYSGAVPVRIDLKAPELQSRALDVGPNDVMVEVDRGVAGFAYPLSSRSVDEFLADRFAGWGETANTRSSPLYAEVAAIRRQPCRSRPILRRSTGSGGTTS